jgi:hypothetical protein
MLRNLKKETFFPSKMFLRHTVIDEGSCLQNQLTPLTITNDFFSIEFMSKSARYNQQHVRLYNSAKYLQLILNFNYFNIKHRFT